MAALRSSFAWLKSTRAESTTFMNVGYAGGRRESAGVLCVHEREGANRVNMRLRVQVVRHG